MVKLEAGLLSWTRPCSTRLRPFKWGTMACLACDNESQSCLCGKVAGRIEGPDRLKAYARAGISGLGDTSMARTRKLIRSNGGEETRSRKAIAPCT